MSYRTAIAGIGRSVASYRVIPKMDAPSIMTDTAVGRIHAQFGYLDIEIMP